MAVPRPVLLALLGLGLLASVFLVTRNGSNDAVKSSTAPVAKSAAAPGASAKAGVHKATPGKDSKGHRASGREAAAKPSGPNAGAAGKASSQRGVEARVLGAARALGEGKAVIFFFSKPGAADDVGARVAMRSLRGMDRVEIFDATLDELAVYRPMLSSVGISQIPSTVIVRPGKKAILLQGFVDAGTLRQNVADALR